jgi:hypothetical protein
MGRCCVTHHLDGQPSQNAIAIAIAGHEDG